MLPVPNSPELRKPLLNEGSSLDKVTSLGGATIHGLPNTKQDFTKCKDSRKFNKPNEFVEVLISLKS